MSGPAPRINSQLLSQVRLFIAGQVFVAFVYNFFPLCQAEGGMLLYAGMPDLGSVGGMQHVNQEVTVVGRVKSMGGGSFVHLEGPDGGDIVIDRSGSSRQWGSEFVEVVGVVSPDRTVKVGLPTFSGVFAVVFLLGSLADNRFSVGCIRAGVQIN
jgi:hypothetical protein